MINMTYSFQDPQNLYIVLDYCGGGDLRYNLSKYKKFNEETIKFIISNIIIILDYLHSKNVIHRDIKPQNFVIGKQGIIYLIDFGLSKRFRDPKTGAHIPYKDGKHLWGPSHSCRIH